MTKTTYCPDQEPIINPFLVGGESSQFQIPAEGGHTIDQTFPGDITSHIVYVLHVM
ncbi:MAG: hypothetical protein LJE94_09760 [Deltaproteobacteria bacterium]|nr:hypothetical protein [Deltaproteobacteria bacterium]